MRGINRRFALVLSLVLAATVAAALMTSCSPKEPASDNGSGNTPPETTTEPTPTPEPTKSVVARLYFVRAEKIGVAGRTLTVDESQSTTSGDYLAGVVAGLLEGPTADEQEWGLSTAIPAGTQVLSVETTGTLATVDLSKEFESGGGSLSMQLRIAQMVCTLTQYEGISEVAFKIDGKPVESIGGEGVIVSPSVSRADIEDQLPPILVEGPYPGEEIASPVTIWGTSNVFEATSQINITDPDGLIVAEQTVTASSGTGTRGTWSVDVPYETKRAGLGEVIAFDYSAKDGSKQNIVEIPVQMKP